jgi:hypothetical protein
MSNILLTHYEAINKA